MNDTLTELTVKVEYLKKRIRITINIGEKAYVFEIP